MTPPAVAAAPRKKPPRKASKAGRWRAIVLLLVHVAIAAHVAHWVVAGETITPLEPSEGMEFSKRGVVNAGLVFFLVMIATTALVGRFFCGWACHLIAIQDACTWILKRLRIRPKPFRSKALMVVPMAAFAYMFLWPAFWRLFLAPADVPVEAWELHQEFTTSGFWDTFPDWPIAVLTLLVAGFGAVYFLGNKGFCTYMCPYGAVLGLADRLSPWRIRVSDACEGCGHCTAACGSNVQVHAEVRDYGAVVDAGCMKCLDCVSACPNDALSLSFGAPALATGLRPDRRAGAPATPIPRWRPMRYGEYSLKEEFLLGGLYLVFFFTFRGLYTQIPFLFSLAIAGILAFLAVETLRLLRGRTSRLQNLSLRRGARWTGTGRAYLACMGLLLAFSAHSAAVRWNEVQRDRAWEETAQARFEAGREADWTPGGTERKAAEALRTAAGRVEHWGLVENWRNTERLAWGALLLGDRDAFEDRMRAALKQSGGRPHLHASYGRLLATWNRGREAEAHLRLALEAEPGHDEAGYVLAGVLAGTGRLEQAEAVLAEAVAHHPDEALLWTGLGRLRRERGRPADALTAFEAAVDRAPGFAEAWVELAATHAALGREDAARDALAQARALAGESLDPRLAERLEALGERLGDRPTGRSGAR